MVYAFIKIFLSQATIDKIRLLNGPQDLKPFVDEDQLPEELGGSSGFIYDPYVLYGFAKDA